MFASGAGDHGDRLPGLRMRIHKREGSGDFDADGPEKMRRGSLPGQS